MKQLLRRTKRDLLAPLFDITGYDSADLNIDYEQVENGVQVTVTGENIDGDSYDSVLYPGIEDKADVVQVVLSLPVEEDKTYTVKQTNEVLKTLYPLDFANGIKQQDYSGADLIDGYAVLLSESTKPVTVEVTDKAAKKVIYTVTINSEITFA